MGFRFFWSIESLVYCWSYSYPHSYRLFYEVGRSSPVKKTTSEIVCNFLKENILTRFGVPQKIVTDNALFFSFKELSISCYDHGILLSHSSNYYPQGNGQTESSNKNLISIMQKLVAENTKDLHKRLYE